ncbi:MAG: hypothetical protein QY316_11220 [Thermodesulfobacteriota bacterium]|nr:MAG: hypothetical protein QY316_11220 [Thermodesulfobacteriota bacterium]
MPNGKDRKLNRLLFALAAVLLILFSVSIFRHISYPLLWNDEGDTAMFATRILEYGFPKVHDGKNVLYVHPVRMDLGVNKFGMYTADAVLTYYMAVPGAWLAQMSEDIYTKTLLFRLPFAIMGLLGVLVFALTASNFFEKKKPARPLFYALYFLFALTSISLALHLREARYYSPIVLFSACIFYSYINHRLFGKLSFMLHTAVVAAMLLFIFHNFYPLYIVFIAFIGAYELVEMAKKLRREREQGRAFALPGIRDFRHFLPLVFSILTVIPFVIVFRTVEVILDGAPAMGFSLAKYLENLYFTMSFFAKHEFLYLAIFTKAALVLAILLNRPAGKRTSGSISKRIIASNFLTFFFAVHVIAIAGVPYEFTRYFIVLLPVLYIILLLDASSVYAILEERGGSGRKWQRLFLIAAAGIFLFTAYGKAEDIKGRIYELTHQYRGPLDFIVAYVKENHEKPEDLIIATNYEEASLMYYLGSKVIIGYTWNNFEEDMRETADILVYRSFWGGDHTRGLFYRRLMKKADYEAVTFPVLDLPANNIPDLHYRIRHFYRTPIAEYEAGRLKIHIRRDNPTGGARQTAGPEPVFQR